MADLGLEEGAYARVTNIMSRPERNGTCVRVGKRLRPEAEDERWETRDEFTWVEASYRRTNLEVLTLSDLAKAMYRLLTTQFVSSVNSSNDLIYHLIAHDNHIPLLHLAQLDVTMGSATSSDAIVLSLHEVRLPP